MYNLVPQKVSNPMIGNSIGILIDGGITTIEFNNLYTISKNNFIEDNINKNVPTKINTIQSPSINDNYNQSGKDYTLLYNDKDATYFTSNHLTKNVLSNQNLIPTKVNEMSPYYTKIKKVSSNKYHNLIVSDEDKLLSIGRINNVGVLKTGKDVSVFNEIAENIDEIMDDREVSTSVIITPPDNQRSDIGYSIEISGDGSRMVSGGQSFNSHQGIVRIHSKINNTWYVSDISGINSSNFGYSVSITDSGDYIAIGAPEIAGGKKGFVRIYQHNSNDTWDLLGSGFDLSGTNLEDKFGYNVSISVKDNNPIVASLAYDTNPRYIRIHQYDGTYSQIGTDISVNNMENVSFAKNNWEYLSIGIPTEKKVLIYQYQTTDWVQIGSITESSGNNSPFGFGYSHKLTKNGKNIFIHDSVEGEVRIYKYLNQWTQYKNQSNENYLLTTITGGNIDISESGHLLAIGHPYYDDNKGTYYLYHQTLLNNTQIGYQRIEDMKIVGSTDDQLGQLIALSSIGNRLMISSSVGNYIDSVLISNYPETNSQKLITNLLDILTIPDDNEKETAKKELRLELLKENKNNNYFTINNVSDYLSILNTTNIASNTTNKSVRVHLVNELEWDQFDYPNYNHFILTDQEKLVIKNGETTILDLTYQLETNNFTDGTTTYQLDHLFTKEITTDNGTITKYFRIVGIGSGSFFGDPHIITLTGIRYYLDYLGYFRLLRYQDENNIIYINGLSQKGTQRWKNKQYIKKLFIKHNQKEILIDLGFRGEKSKVLENNGFEYQDIELDFDSQHKIHCFNRYCLKEFNNWKDAEKHLKEVRNRHIIKKPIRNEIIIKINDLMELNISNVNKYNYQPCRLIIIPLNNFNINLASGTIVDPKYSKNPNLESLKDLSDIIYDFNFEIKTEEKSKLEYLI